MPIPVAVRGSSNLVNARHHDADRTALSIGYTDVRPWIATAALLIGDAVYADASAQAAKSATNANYATALGIVVGGDSFDKAGGLAMVSTLVGNAAAAASGLVWVAGIGSIVYGVAGAAITRGARVGISATSGRVDDIATGNLFAICLDTATTTGDKVRLLIISPYTLA